MHTRILSATVALVALALGGVAVAAPASAADADVRINEVRSNSTTGAPDFIELVNVGTAPVDISGWVLRDDQDANGDVFDAGTVLEPGAFLVVEPTFGLGANDSARLFDDALMPIDAYSWTAHAFTEGRLPDGTGAFVDTEPTPGAANVARVATVQPQPAETGIRINEVLSNDPVLPDFVELTNVGATPVDVSGWILRDDDPLSTLRIAAGTIVAPGAFVVIETNASPDGFGLGRVDAISVITADGTGLADTYAWTDHATSEGRVPDGTGAFVDTEITRGQANVERRIASPIVLNEVESSGDPVSDWVELANTDTVNPVDVSGWTIRDGDPTNPTITLPAGTEIESGGYLGIRTDSPEDVFGLGSTDRVTVRDQTGAVIDTFGWSGGHAPTTFGRCPDMTGAFGVTARSTFATMNACDVVEAPQGQPWPFGQSVVDAIARDTFGDDTSGLDLGADGTLYVVNNGLGEVYAMSATDGVYAVDRTWSVTYPDGTGQPDSEGVSVAGDGSLLLATERNDAASAVSRPSVLRIVPGADGTTTATQEWNLAGITGPIGANGGPEAVEWISDEDAVRLGVVGADGQPYDPAAFGPHLGGIAAVAVESTGLIHLVVLEEDGTATLLQTTQPGDVAPFVMSLDWRAGGNELWGLCDDVCGNTSAQYAFVDGVLGVQGEFEPPAAMDPTFTNEGMVIQWCDANPDAVPTVLWASDSAHGGISLRAAPGGDCVAVGPGPGPTPGGPPPTGPAPTDPAPTDPVPTAPTAPTAPTPTAPPVAGGEAAGQSGTLPRTGSEGAFGVLALALLLMAAGGVLVARRSAAGRP